MEDSKHSRARSDHTRVAWPSVVSLANPGHKLDVSTPDDDEPIPLREATRFFPRARFTLSTLRAEAARGHLEVFRVGRADYTTPRALRQMIRRCRDADPRRASTSIRQDANGSSRTEATASALAALRQSVGARKGS
jgi:hypothetical protein